MRVSQNCWQSLFLGYRGEERQVAQVVTKLQAAKISRQLQRSLLAWDPALVPRDGLHSLRVAMTDSPSGSEHGAVPAKGGFGRWNRSQILQLSAVPLSVRPVITEQVCKLAVPKSLVLPMPNFSSVIKSEITRLARKEIKSAIEPVRKANAEQRRQIADLKRQLASLQRGLKTVSKLSTGVAAAAEKPDRNTRFVPKGLKSLRARLGLSAADFGVLVGASGQSVYNWEAGKSVPREAQQAALVAARGLGKREAAKRLEELA